VTHTIERRGEEKKRKGKDKDRRDGTSANHVRSNRLRVERSPDDPWFTQLNPHDAASGPFFFSSPDFLLYCCLLLDVW